MFGFPFVAFVFLVVIGVDREDHGNQVFFTFSHFPNTGFASLPEFCF